MVAVQESAVDFFEQMKGAPVIGGVIKRAPNEAKNAFVAATSFAGIDYYADAKLRGLILDRFKTDIDAPLLDKASTIPGVNLLKKKDLAYGAIALATAKKNKKAALFIAGAILLKRWLESHGATTSGNPAGKHPPPGAVYVVTP